MLSTHYTTRSRALKNRHKSARPQINGDDVTKEKTRHKETNKKKDVILLRLLRAAAVVLAVVLLFWVLAGSSVAKDGPPADLVVHGKLAKYTPVPETYRRRFYVPAGSKAATTMIRTYRSRGWTLADSPKDAHVVYVSRITPKFKKYFKTLEPCQRFSRIPGSSNMESKDGFLAGFRRYQESSNKSLYFLPETYRLVDETDKKAFQKQLELHGGMDRPWVLKKVRENNGVGIEMLGPNSEALRTAVKRADADEDNQYIVQAYICNELVWFGRQKFDLRFYWLVASVDPPIVLYHDGYVRVGASEYNDKDFSSTRQHLTNHMFRTEDQSEVTKEYLWKLVREHYNNHRRELSKRIKIDPVQHVRNQMKEAMAATVAAFMDVSFGNAATKATTENLFAFYGADFVLDNDLDVWYLEAQTSPGVGESYEYRIEMFRELFQPMVDIVEEIQLKQVKDGQANILPLESLGGWEIVYAGDWQYTYEGYERSPDKKSCETL